MEKQKLGNRRNKSFSFIIIILFFLIVVIISYKFIRTTENNNIITNTNTSLPNTNSNNTTNSSISNITNIIKGDGQYDYQLFLLNQNDLPDGMILHIDNKTLIEGGNISDGYVRFYQKITYPTGTSKITNTPLNLTMQALITEDTEMLDNFQNKIDTGTARIYSPKSNYEADDNRVVGPAAMVRTKNAIFFLISDRMFNWMSCQGTEDCEALATTGRNLNEDELAILKKYINLFESYTGLTQEEWAWSYVGYGNY